MSKFSLFDELASMSSSEAYLDEWILEYVNSLDEYGDSACICGHDIKYEYGIRNKITNSRIVVGSCCITKLGMKPGLRSKREYLEYALLTASKEWERCYVENIIKKLERWGSRIMISKSQKEILERVTKRSWRWPVWGIK